MGHSANSSRNASLDDKKLRAAGRDKDRDPVQEAILDAQSPQSKRQTGGAFGREGASTISALESQPPSPPEQPDGGAEQPST